MSKEEQIKQGRDNFARGLDWLRGQADVVLENIDEIVDDLFVQADSALEALYQKALAAESGVQEKNLSQEEVYNLIVNDLASWSEHVDEKPQGSSEYRNAQYEPRLFLLALNAWFKLPADFKSKSVFDWLGANPPSSMGYDVPE